MIQLFFHIKFGKNIYKDTYKYTASVAERVDDLNEMIYDENVRLVFFGGGYAFVLYSYYLILAIFFIGSPHFPRYLPSMEE